MPIQTQDLRDLLARLDQLDPSLAKLAQLVQRVRQEHLVLSLDLQDLLAQRGLQAPSQGPLVQPAPQDLQDRSQELRARQEPPALLVQQAKPRARLVLVEPDQLAPPEA